MAKHILVTGGVSSSLGKGITAASLGRLLTARGLRVTMQKLDPYVNVDPGTMNPFQHGEVFVTHDGGETDLDLGHYERFIDVQLPRQASVSTGQIYSTVIAKERKGDYMGETVQVVPHITNEIKKRILELADEVDVVISEVGGTVGDIEGLPFLEAIRQIRYDVGRENICYVHCALVPFIGPTKELKTKPAQHSVRELRSIGIQPDALVCRADRPIPLELKRKIAMLSDIDLDGVVSAHDAHSIYAVPAVLQEEGLDQFVVRRLGLDPKVEPDMTEWNAMVSRLENPKEIVRIGLVGKYVSLPDAYLSVVESLDHAGIHHQVDVDIQWVQSDELVNRSVAEEKLANLDGILIPGGFGIRGVEGKINAGRCARERQIPYLGICLGLQTAVIEFARNVLGLPEAHSSEFDADTPDPVIALMEEQRDVTDLGGTMRLGIYPCKLTPGTKSEAAYGQNFVYERHRHRWEVANKYRSRLEAAGMVLSGLSPNDRLVEMIELADHPWFVATQAHPEFLSRPNRPHPLFRDFVGAALDRMLARQGRLPNVNPPPVTVS
ncbi:CTP synthase [Euzebya tangerina]|uniref:CTP synthase n=1 Tax=Euzebya tangerina TaxID=591198 RepID=UPI000E312132|nr:CTP synthase [Euzebya tangerina]